MRLLLAPLLLVAFSAHAQTLVVVNKADDDVSLIDVASGATQARLPVGEGPHEVAVSPDGRWALVTQYGRSQPGNSVALIDIEGATVLETHGLGAHAWPHGVAWEGDRVWIAAEDDRMSGSLLGLDPVDGRTLAAVPTAQSVSHMLALHPDGRRTYVSNIVSDSVSVIDRTTGRLLQVLPVGRGPEGIAVSPDGRELWVAHQGDSDIRVYDTATLAEVSRIAAPGRPIRIVFTPDGGRALVTGARTNDLAVIDARTKRQITRVRFDHEATPGWPFGQAASPVSVIVSPQGSHAYVALVASDQIAEVDLRTYAIVRLIAAGNQPDGLGWSERDVAPR